MKMNELVKAVSDYYFEIIVDDGYSCFDHMRSRCDYDRSDLVSDVECLITDGFPVTYLTDDGHYVNTEDEQGVPFGRFITNVSKTVDKMLEEKEAQDRLLRDRWMGEESCTMTACDLAKYIITAIDTGKWDDFSELKEYLESLEVIA